MYAVICTMTHLYRIANWWAVTLGIRARHHWTNRQICVNQDVCSDVKRIVW